MLDEIVIVAAKRTPIGGLLGKLKHLSAIDLGVISHLAAIEQADIQKDMINEVIMGCVLPAGLGQAPARQTLIRAGMPEHLPAVTLNKVCGSGMQALIYAHDSIATGRNQVVLAGGMESMTHAPYLLPKARAGMRLGHQECIDSMWFDGLQDAYDQKLMGCFGELAAKTLNLSRETQDAFARRSMEKALRAQKDGSFLAELAIVIDTQETVIADEQPSEAKLDKLPRLKPVFEKDGTITAGNASSIADGAASLILMKKTVALSMGLKPLAVIKGFSQHAQAPEWFTTAPTHAIKKLLQQLNWQVSDIDLWEINEAFAVVPLAAQQALHIPDERLNIHGGACALGHPIGASGARIVVTLVNAMLQHQQQNGIAAICIGGGEALAMAVSLC